MRLYFLYTAPIIEAQTKTLQKSFHSLWRNSFKQFMGLPANLPSETLERILHSTEHICRETNQYRKRRMTKSRYLIRTFLKKLKTSPKMLVSPLNRFFYSKLKNSHVFDPIFPLQKIDLLTIF
jgi:hypothetical protein